MPKKGAALDVTIATWAAMSAVLIGWILLNTLVVSVGSVRHQIHFFELFAAIANPPRVLLGLDDGHMFSSVICGLLCCVVAFAPLLTRLFAPRLTTAAFFAPLALMLLVALALYVRTSGDLLAAPDPGNVLGGNLVRLANDLLNRGMGVAARSVAVGAGGYVAAIASVWLAVQGGRRLRP